MYPGKDVPVKRVSEAGSKCRKLAMMHPMLVVR